MLQGYAETLVLDFLDDEEELFLLKIYSDGHTELGGVGDGLPYERPEPGTVKISLVVPDQLIPPETLKRRNGGQCPEGMTPQTFQPIGVIEFTDEEYTPAGWAIRIMKVPEEAKEIYDGIITDYYSRQMKKAS